MKLSIFVLSQTKRTQSGHDQRRQHSPRLWARNFDFWATEIIGKIGFVLPNYY
jgi:hypothetical protein